jgi:5-methylthioadenosine/S-adenosylhomocysteine deaminase
VTASTPTARQLDLLLLNAKVMNSELDGFVDAHVGVADGVILSVDESRPAVGARETIDLGGAVLLPGFISAHTHVAQSFGKGIFDGLHLTQWLTTLRRTYADLTDEQVYAATLLGALESIRSGVTFINDMATVGERFDVVAQAIVDSGVRAHIGSAFLDRREGDSPAPTSSTDQVLEQMSALHRRWDGAGEGRVRVAISPVGLPACSRALMEQSAALARELDAPLHTHCSEEKAATAESWDRFGMSEVRALEEFGVLGDRTTLAHCVWVDDDDIATIARHGALVAHCPSTNMKITDGIAPIEALRIAGAKLGLGTDGAASSGSYDILQEMRLAGMLAKVATMDSGALPNATLWSMLVGTAAHFRVTPPGTAGLVTVGATADLTVIRYPSLHLIDETRFLSNLVFSATAGDVVHVVVDGQLVLRHGRFTRHDEDEVTARALRSMASMAPLPPTS